MPTPFSPRPLRFSLRLLCAVAFFALFTFRAQAAPQPIAIAVGGNNLTQLLWNNPDASLSLWKLAADGSVTTQSTYGPYSGWTGQALAAGADSVPRILWKHAPDGQLSLWHDTAGAGFTHTEFGPYTGYTAQSLAVGGDNVVRLLWAKSDGTLSLWHDVNSASGFSHAEFGPFSGYQPALLGVGANSVPHVLWNRNDGAISLWNDVQGTGDYSHAEYGPYTGYAPLALAVDSTSAPRVLWTGPSSTVSLWKVAASGTFAHAEYADPSGYLPVGIACGTGGDVRLLWSDGQGDAQVWTIAADGTHTAKTYPLAASTPAYLSNLTLNSTATTGGSNVTGTVTLSSPSSTATTVALSSNSSAVVVPVPANVTIPAGAVSQTFAISSSSVASPVLATLSARFGGWTQAATLSVLPVNQSYDIQSLNTTPGNTCVLLSWAEMPEGSIRGYNVYRINGTSRTQLTPIGPQISNEFADTGLTNGTAYQYQVSVVDVQNQEHLSSATVASTPSMAVPILSWVSPPASISGTSTLHASVSSGNEIVSAELLVDGKTAGSGGTPVGGASSANTEATIDSTTLANGSHTVQLVGYLDGNSACATPPLTIQTSNPISSLKCDDIYQPSQGQVDGIEAQLSAGINQFSVQITSDDTGNVVRSWQGITSTVHLAWDGSGINGSLVPEGNYTIHISASAPSNPATARLATGASVSVSAVRTVALANNDPQALALIGTISEGDVSKDFELAFAIRADFKRMQNSNPGFTFEVFTSDGHESLRMRALVRKWMGTTVKDFYYFGHGWSDKGSGSGYTPRGVPWGHTLLWSAAVPTTNSWYRVWHTINPSGNIVVPEVVASRIYNFAWIDACDQAGGHTDNASPPGEIITAPDDVWARAFTVETNGLSGSSFLGWDGFGVQNAFSDGTPTYWLKWREGFWNDLATGYTVSQAFGLANMNTPGPVPSINPANVSSGIARAQFFGDQYTTYLP